jgi:anti-anti-sigma factor
MKPEMWQLEITAITPSCGILVAGEVDLATLPLLELALEILCGGSEHVTVDLAGLTFIDCGGLRALATAALFLRRSRRRMTLHGVQPRLRRIIRLLGYEGLFEFSGPRDTFRSVPTAAWWWQRHARSSAPARPRPSVVGEPVDHLPLDQ